jgi:hypothetical protein
VQCYAPTQSAELIDKEALYSLLDKTLLGIKWSDIIVKMGDFNAQVGNKIQYNEHIMGRHRISFGNENGNGQFLIELCGKHELLIGGMVFSHRDFHKATWVSPDKGNQVENQIDHIRISWNWSKSLLDVRNRYWVRASYDHGILRIKVQKVKRKTTNRKKYKLKKLDDIECERILKAKLREGASSLRYVVPEGVEEKWEGLKTTLQDICENTLGLENNKKKEWISDSTWKMIERRNQMKGRICAVHTRTRKRKELEKEYAALCKEVNKSVRKDYRAYVDSITNEAQVAANQANITGMFSSIRLLTNNVRTTTIPIRDKEGKTTTSIEGQIHSWKEYLEEILNTSTSLIGREEPVSLSPELPISIRPPSKREVVDAIKALKIGKAAGSDNIPAEVLKADPYATADILPPLFQDNMAARDVS